MIYISNAMCIMFNVLLLSITRNKQILLYIIVEYLPQQLNNIIGNESSKGLSIRLITMFDNYMLRIL